VEHVDALITWWKQANPRKASVIEEELSHARSESVAQVAPMPTVAAAESQDTCCCILS
jgi:hypothetical protein